MKSRVVCLLAALAVFVVPLKGWAQEDAVGIITHIELPDQVVIVSDTSRKAALFDVVQPGDQVLVKGLAQVSIQVAGSEQVVTAENSPYRLAFVETGDTVADNVLDWALSVLGADAGEAEEVRAVAMASRGLGGLDIFYIEPFENILQRRNALTVAHGSEVAPDYASFSSDDAFVEPKVTVLREGLTQVDTRELPAGDYRMSICAGERCRHFSIHWRDGLKGDLPDSYEKASHPLLGSLTLIEEGGAYRYEGFQQLWGYRDRYELANRLLSRLTLGQQAGSRTESSREREGDQ